jgi:quinol monooxygenase YgiN
LAASDAVEARDSVNVLDRRQFLALAASAAVPPFVASYREGATMYGLIGKMMTAPGQRDAVIGILLEGTMKMPGCLSYIVAADPDDPQAIWITEVWDSEANHKASLSLPAVQSAIAKARPSITGFGERFVTRPVGGVGLPPR